MDAGSGQRAERRPQNATGAPEPPLGSNAVRLSPREWCLAAAIFAAVLVLLPRVWQRIEPLEAGPDYRIPYSLGEDYWMYQRWCSQACAEEKMFLVGDSVIWGHYVASDQTLSHWLNELSCGPHYVNLGLDGTHPAALAGLMESYGRDLREKNVVLFCNPLWMSTRDADLQGEKQGEFNHPRLVAQFSSPPPCYTEPVDSRLGIVVERYFPFLRWARHVRARCLENEDPAAWAMKHPYDIPTSNLLPELPLPDEPPSPKPVAKPWTVKRMDKTNSPWVDLHTSYQWASFQRAIEVLQDRGNRVFVLVGPFNEHMLKPESLKRYQHLKADIGAWLTERGIPHFLPEPLPSEMYADASHPLSNGYALLAQELVRCEAFTTWLTSAHTPAMIGAKGETP